MNGDDTGKVEDVEGAFEGSENPGWVGNAENELDDVLGMDNPGARVEKADSKLPTEFYSI